MPEITSEALASRVERVLDLSHLPPTAAITCDVEPDYGGRTGTCELIEDRRYLDLLVSSCRALDAPLSVFIVTTYLEGNLGFVGAVGDHDLDAHAHSHTHRMKSYAADSSAEIAASANAFRQCFGRDALGYRAPQGLVLPGDDEVLAENGFCFSASVFPARRRRLFDYRALPRTPWRWKSGVVELPFASTQGGGKMLTVSYLKLLGKLYWRRVVAQPKKLPRLLVIDSHLHDFFLPASFGKLPLAFRLAYSRNKTGGFALLSWLVAELRRLGYAFTTMSELCRRVCPR